MYKNILKGRRTATQEKHFQTFWRVFRRVQAILGKRKLFLKNETDSNANISQRQKTVGVSRRREIRENAKD